jgi:hypothetical protein
MSYGAVSPISAAPSAQNRGKLRAAVLGVAAVCAVALAATANWAHGDEGEKVRSPPPGVERFGSRERRIATRAGQPTRARHRTCVLILSHMHLCIERDDAYTPVCKKVRSLMFRSSLPSLCLSSLLSSLSGAASSLRSWRLVGLLAGGG